MRLFLAYSFLKIFIHKHLQFFRDLEDWNIMFFNFHLFARSRIPGNSPFPFFHFETAEAANFNIPSIAQRSNHCLNETINNCFRFHLRQTGARSDDVNNIGFRHVRSPVLLWLHEFVLQYRLIQNLFCYSCNFIFHTSH